MIIWEQTLKIMEPTNPMSNVDYERRTFIWSADPCQMLNIAHYFYPLNKCRDVELLSSVACLRLISASEDKWGSSVYSLLGQDWAGQGPLPGHNAGSVNW